MSSELEGLPMPLGSTLFIESGSLANLLGKRRSESSEESGLDNLGGLASVVLEMERLAERQGKRLCAFRQSGTCRLAVPV
jgi:hypothetical protein